MTTVETATSMDQVAKLAGLSRATISDIVNDRWEKKGISRKTHDRVKQLMEQYNYRPNALARGLAFGKTFNIGVQLPSTFYEHWMNVQRFLDGAFRKRGYHMTMASPTAFHKHEEEEIGHLCDRQVDGLILSPTRGVTMHALFNRIKLRGIPFVFIGDSPLPDHYGVVDDNKGQARMAVEHLIRLGHKRIAYLHSTSCTGGERERRRGYLETMKDWGLPIRQDYMKFCCYEFDRSGQKMKEMLELPEPPTAVYCAADAIAMGAIDGALSLGRRVPDDLAVVGHADDIPFVSQYRVPLTSVRQPRQNLAEISAWMLLDLIEGREPVQSYVRLPGELMVRASCGGSPR